MNTLLCSMEFCSTRTTKSPTNTSLQSPSRQHQWWEISLYICACAHTWAIISPVVKLNTFVSIKSCVSCHTRSWCEVFAQSCRFHYIFATAMLYIIFPTGLQPVIISISIICMQIVLYWSCTVLCREACPRIRWSPWISQEGQVAWSTTLWKRWVLPWRRDTGGEWVLHTITNAACLSSLR